MRYLEFKIENYRAIKELTVNISKERIIPLIGINECGKTTILQAIYCFDYSNDDYSDGRHLKNIRNLYEPNNKRFPKISATLSVSSGEFKDAFKDTFKDTHALYANELHKKSSSTTNQGTDSDKAEEGVKHIAEQQKKLADWWGESERKLRITRELKEPKELSKYIAITIDGQDINEQFADIGMIIPQEKIDSFVKVLLVYGPHILYSDDFHDRPPTEIIIPNNPEIPIKDERRGVEWGDIYKILFMKSSSQLSLHSVANETDERIQESQLAQVQYDLNKKLEDAWGTFLPQQEKKAKSEQPFTIRLKIGKKDNKHKKMSITVVETLKDSGAAEKTFNIVDRSKGFVWYFTLVMKIYYNPKSYRQRSNSNTIFLLDEPGSYLHADAQSALCEQLKRISKERGTVIYCTHTPHLLNPKFIATNKVRIVEKNQNNNIDWRCPQLIGKDSIEGAEKPLFEALHLPYFHALNAQKPSILVEGIYDAYTLRLFINHTNYFSEQSAPNIVPASSAHSILNLLSYFIGFQFNYVALWDDDDEGRKKLERAEKEFGELEARRFILLSRPKDNAGKDTKRNTEMEDMLANSDVKKIANKLEIDTEPQNKIDKNFKNKTILALFSANQKQQASIIKALSPETHHNFKALFDEIKRALGAAKRTAPANAPAAPTNAPAAAPDPAA